MTIQEIVKKKLDAKGIKKIEISRETGIAFSSVRAFLEPSPRVNLDHLKKVCDLLEVSRSSVIQELDEQEELSLKIKQEIWEDGK